MRVVSNSSPLIALARIHRLDLLPALFDGVLMPPAVAHEISRSIPVLPSWLALQTLAGPQPVLMTSGRLGAGEREAIALAQQNRVELIILDDLPARRFAAAAGLEVIGTLGILLSAKHRGLIDAIRPELDGLLKTSFFLAPALYDLLLRQAEEP